MNFQVTGGKKGIAYKIKEIDEFSMTTLEMLKENTYRSTTVYQLNYCFCSQEKETGRLLTKKHEECTTRKKVNNSH